MKTFFLAALNKSIILNKLEYNGKKVLDNRRTLKSLTDASKAGD
jgi:hypothetical protein